VAVDWAAVYRATYQDLVRYLHRKVWDEERARDLAQEAFVRALDHAPDNPRAFLFTVAANLARDESKTVLRRRRHLTLLQAEATEGSGEPDPVERMEATRRQEGARRALETLAERDREVLLLWDAGLSYGEIAERTGLSPGAIGTTLARARRRLVEAYEAVEADHVARG
jgi:RNA polymerase sigma-70 factor (ECF subfamily)